MDREDQLVNALMHIAKVAHNSRTKTKRLAFIEKRALDAVENYVVLSELDGFICEQEWEDFYETEVKYWLQK